MAELNEGWKRGFALNQRGAGGQSCGGEKSKTLKDRQENSVCSLGGVKCTNNLTGTSSCIFSLLDLYTRKQCN